MRSRRLKELFAIADLTCCRVQKRSIHQLKRLDNLDLEKGLPPFLSANALRMLAVDYQQGLLDRLNDLSRGTPWESSSLVQTVMQTARDRHHILAFNLASEALNNAYFLSRLTDDPGQQARFSEKASTASTSQTLLSALTTHFSSLTAFQDAFSSAAMGMSGSGYTWLVMDGSQKLGIVGTYGAGTVLVQDRQQRGDMDYQVIGEQTPAEESSEDTPHSLSQSSTGTETPLTSSSGRPSLHSSTSHSPLQQRTPNTPSMATKRDRDDYLHAQTMKDIIKPAMTDDEFHLTPAEQRQKTALHPLFCLSVHERSWITDYGVWGKEAYLANFWKSINWSVVNRTFEKLGGGSKMTR